MTDLKVICSVGASVEYYLELPVGRGPSQIENVNVKWNSAEILWTDRVISRIDMAFHNEDLDTKYPSSITVLKMGDDGYPDWDEPVYETD